MEHFESLEHTESGGHGICSGNGRNNVASHLCDAFYKLRSGASAGLNSRLVSNLDLGSMSKIAARKIAVAVTKSNVSVSSLSNSIIGAGPSDDVFFWSSLRRLLKRSRLSQISQR